MQFIMLNAVYKGRSIPLYGTREKKKFAKLQIHIHNRTHFDWI